MRRHLGHEAIYDATRHAPRKRRGERRLDWKRRVSKCVSIRGCYPRFRTEQESRTELRGLRAKREYGGDALPVHQTAGGDEGFAHPSGDAR